MSRLKKEVVDELHKPARRNFRRRRVVLKGIDDLWQADLIEMIPYEKDNLGYRYILAVIDCFSKFAWVEPCKRKSDQEIFNAFKKILIQGRYPRNLQTDQGNEFYNKKFKKIIDEYNVNHYSTYSNIKASIVERFIRTFKTNLWKYFSVQGSYKWFTCIQNIVTIYNNTKHRTINMKPIEVVGTKIEKTLLEKRYRRPPVFSIPRYIVGDSVRISKNKGVFEKGYKPSWSTEIFKIDKVNKTNPVTYLLRDSTGQEIAGCFYEQELQVTKHPDVYLVEKTIRKKGDKFFVKWLGFDSSHNSWVKKEDLGL